MPDEYSIMSQQGRTHGEGLDNVLPDNSWDGW